MAKARRPNQKPGMGAPRRLFTRQECSLVERMSEAGATQAAIAKALRTTDSTLRRHFGTGLKGKQRRGRRPTVPTQFERDLVGLCIGIGVTQPDVALAVGCSVHKLQHDFPEELRSSRAKLRIRMTTRLAQMGLEGDRQALLSVMRATFGWSDRGVEEVGLPPDDLQADLRKTLEDLDQEGRDALEIVLKQMGATATLSTQGPGPSDPIQ